MDTRDKITSLERLPSLLQNGSWRVMTGVFDPMTKEQAVRITSQARDGSKLLVVVEIGTDPYLDELSRAKLVAALRSVDAVAIASKEQQRSVIPPCLVVDGGEIDARWTADFVQFVLKRQQSATADKPTAGKTS